MAKSFNQVAHPAIEHKLTILRDQKTDSRAFREIMNDIGRFLAYEATRDLSTKEIEIETPLAKTTKNVVADYPVVVSILRAGNGLIDGVLETLPFASAGHIGIYRDKFIKNTVEYYFKIPENSKGREVLLIDPLLATADTAVACIDRLKQYEVGKIKMLCLLASPAGLERLHHFHPDVDVWGLSVEEGLNDQGYLLPGLGDAGDRLYNTK